MQFFGNFGKIISVLADLQSASQEYQHLMLKIHVSSLFFRKNTIFATEKNILP